NRRIFALRRRFERAVPSLCANFSKKSARRLDTATRRGLSATGFCETGLSGGGTIRGGCADGAGCIWITFCAGGGSASGEGCSAIFRTSCRCRLGLWTGQRNNRRFFWSCLERRRLELLVLRLG